MLASVVSAMFFRASSVKKPWWPVMKSCDAIPAPNVAGALRVVPHADDFDRAIGARRDSRRHAADQESVEPPHPSRPNEDAVGLHLVSLTAQQRLRLPLSHHYRNLQPRRSELFRRAFRRLLHQLGFARDPLGQISGLSRIAYRRDRQRRIDDPDLAALRPVSRGDLFDRRISLFGPVYADDDPSRSVRFDNLSAPHANRTAGVIDHFLRDAAEKHLTERRAAVRADHDQIGAPFIGSSNDLAAGRSDARFGPNFPVREERLYSGARQAGHRQCILFRL